MTTEQRAFPFTAVARVGDVQPGEGKLVRPINGPLARKALALFNEEGRYYAINYICPHSGGPMGEGTVKDGIVECPFHGWSFYLETGLPHQSLDHSISAYEVRVDGEDILVGPLKKPQAAP